MSYLKILQHPIQEWPNPFCKRQCLELHLIQENSTSFPFHIDYFHFLFFLVNLFIFLQEILIIWLLLQFLLQILILLLNLQLVQIIYFIHQKYRQNGQPLRVSEFCRLILHKVISIYFQDSQYFLIIIHQTIIL